MIRARQEMESIAGSVHRSVYRSGEQQRQNELLLGRLEALRDRLSDRGGSLPRADPNTETAHTVSEYDPLSHTLVI